MIFKFVLFLIKFGRIFSHGYPLWLMYEKIINVNDNFFSRKKKLCKFSKILQNICFTIFKTSSIGKMQSYVPCILSLCNIHFKPRPDRAQCLRWFSTRLTEIPIATDFAVYIVLLFAWAKISSKTLFICVLKLFYLCWSFLRLFDHKYFERSVKFKD